MNSSKITYRIAAGEDVTIPDDARVIFQVDGGEIETSLRGDEVRVNSGGGLLIIAPVAANAANLWVVR